MPLTRSQIISRCLSRLDRAGDTDLQANLEEEIQILQEQELEGASLKPWFLEATEPALVTIAGTEAIALPNGYLRDQDEDPWSRYDSTSTAPDKWVRLTKDSLEAITEYYKSHAQAAPVHCALTSGQIVFRPIPDAVYTIRARYYKQDVALTSDISNNWLLYASDLVLAKLCQLASDVYLKDDLQVERWQIRADRAWARLRTEHTARREAGAMREMGD